MAATILTVTDLAAKLDTDARTTRKFLRTITPADAQPGKGSRWGIPATQVRSMQAKFKKFTAEAAEATSEAIKAKNAKVIDADHAEALEIDAALEA
jgi:hypothetical protein